MNWMDISEHSYKNGYEKGFEEGKKSVSEKLKSKTNSFDFDYNKIEQLISSMEKCCESSTNILKFNQRNIIIDFLKDNCVGEGYLQNWYIDSVDETQIPIWTEKHIEEMFNDFVLIPKGIVDNI